MTIFTCAVTSSDTLEITPRGGARGVTIEVSVSAQTVAVMLTPADAAKAAQAILKASGVAPAVAATKPSVTFATGHGNLPAHAADGLRRAASALMGMGAWSRTPEGEVFWRSIYDRLVEMERSVTQPVHTALDFATRCPPGYDTIAGFMFAHFGAERALSEEASKAGRDLRAKADRANDPKVQVKAPAAVTATVRHITTVFAHPVADLEAHFKVGAAMPAMTAPAKAKALRGYMAVGVVTVLRETDRELGLLYPVGTAVRITRVDLHDRVLPYRIETLNGRDSSWVRKGKIVDTRVVRSGRLPSEAFTF